MYSCSGPSKGISIMRPTQLVLKSQWEVLLHYIRNNCSNTYADSRASFSHPVHSWSTHQLEISEVNKFLRTILMNGAVGDSLVTDQKAKRYARTGDGTQASSFLFKGRRGGSSSHFIRSCGFANIFAKIIQNRHTIIHLTTRHLPFTVNHCS